MTDAIFHMVEGAPTPVAPYSHAVQVGGWLFVTGQLPIDPRDEKAQIPAGIEAQTRLVFANLEAVLAAARFALRDVVSARVFLTHFDSDYAAMNAIYAGYFANDRRPARTCVGVTALARGARVEIDFVAHKTNRASTHAR